MASEEVDDGAAAAASPTPSTPGPSSFEKLITCNPPILESLLAQVSTESILRLYHTSRYLQHHLRNSPASWRYISWRLSQPSVITPNAAANGRQPGSYSLDRLLLYVINPISTRLASLELDNTAVSGATLMGTVVPLRRETLVHLSVRGCKNVSLKYHINPWLQMYALTKDTASSEAPAPFETLALKSLYTYRCRHHRRRPYLPSSLARKESDSEPTHELVKICHTLGIWTDTAWCTTPGARCYRRRGYVTMRVPQDPREVWVVYDRLWRSRNWTGPIGQASNDDPIRKKRKNDCRFWEYGEEGINGEPVGVQGEGKATPTHLRESHRRFVENITCSNCSEPILERCEQCSVMMHCSGCRKTLCASCAFDRPYLRNKNALEEDKNKFWWAPGCAVSPCSMQDQDLPPPGANNNQPGNPNALPTIKFKWCCTEPVFSGGGGITFGNGSNRETDRVRAAPLPQGHGWEDAEFINHEHSEGDAEQCTGCKQSPEATDLSLAGRWVDLDDFFQSQSNNMSDNPLPPMPIPRILCDECHTSDKWKVKCKGCNNPLCLKHDMHDRLKVRICGYKDLTQEKQAFRSRQKTIKVVDAMIKSRKDKQPEKNANLLSVPEPSTASSSTPPAPETQQLVASVHAIPPPQVAPALTESIVAEAAAMEAEVGALLLSLRNPPANLEHPRRPLSPASVSTDPASRSSSPTPSASSPPATPEPKSVPRRVPQPSPSMPKWNGCNSFFCPSIRPPGDHRRRCMTVMRQCNECKVHVCSDCAGSFETPCPCKGCQVPQAEGTTTPIEPAAQFFCPNCRWNRMATGKCKKKTAAFIEAQNAVRESLNLGLKKLKVRKRKDKAKKPIDQRRGSSSSSGSTNANNLDEIMEGLNDFFTNLNAQHNVQFAPPSAAAEGEAGPSTARTLNLDQNSDLQEIADVGALARDLIRRIQSLRGQFRPGSVAARALPDIRFEDLAASSQSLLSPPAQPVVQSPGVRIGDVTVGFIGPDGIERDIVHMSDTEEEDDAEGEQEGENN
jgi:hypothetical protein